MKRRRGSKKKLSPLDSAGRARMVDVSAKRVTARRAVAAGEVTMLPATLRAISDSRLPKGDVLAAARIAGIQAAKRTHELIPLCHALPLDSVEVEFALRTPQTLAIRSIARVSARTGVEMEALVAVAAAALTIYDMCKAIDRGMEIGRIRLLEKSGGRSGAWVRTGP